MSEVSSTWFLFSALWGPPIFISAILFLWILRKMSNQDNVLKQLANPIKTGIEPGLFVDEGEERRRSENLEGIDFSAPPSATDSIIEPPPPGTYAPECSARMVSSTPEHHKLSAPLMGENSRDIHEKEPKKTSTSTEKGKNKGKQKKIKEAVEQKSDLNREEDTELTRLRFHLAKTLKEIDHPSNEILIQKIGEVDEFFPADISCRPLFLKLAEIIGNDWSEVKGVVSKALKAGYSELYYSLLSITTSFRVANSKKYAGLTTQLGALIDHAGTRHKVMVDQAQNYKTSLEHTAGMLNTLNSSIMSAATKIDELQLKISALPTSVPANYHKEASVTSAQRAPWRTLDIMNGFLSGVTYVSEYGKLRVSTGGEPSFDPSSQDGHILAEMINAKLPKGVKKLLLQRDLSQFICFLKAHPDWINTLAKKPQAEAIEMLKTLDITVPKTGASWKYKN